MARSRPDTMLIREGDHREASSPSGTARRLPSDVLDASIKRVGIIAPLYAVTYFLSGFLPVLISPDRTTFLSQPGLWVPGALSIAVAIVVTGLMRSGLGRTVRIRIGILFEIVGSYGIAAGEYYNVASGMTYHGFPLVYTFGLSWVTVWVMLFTIAVPTAPRTALTAALLSVSAVPIVFGINQALGNNMSLTGANFFYSFVFQNLLVVGLAYGGARIVYRMGKAVLEAREMGSYRLVELLGKGGMGEVWRAEHRMLARPAAIKLIRPEMLGVGAGESVDVLKQRFEREALATSLLRSPHTIEVYDFGVTDDGTFYYVMELLDGFDLDDFVERFGPVEPERTVHFLRHIADSLAEAHDAGLVHRDVKPANVYTCRQGRDLDFIKVLDFGLVKPTNTLNTDVKLTADHSTGGTPAFMSPEQALGESDLDGRSDIYAVGCIGYWLLTGGYVFEGNSPVEMLMRHVKDDPVPPSRRSELTIPPELDAIILQCLAKDRGDRPQTGDELRAALDAIPLNNRWTRDRARKWWDTHHVSSAPRVSTSSSGHFEVAPPSSVTP